MRMLFTTTSGAGHFLPLVPLAEAAIAAGHAVAVAAPVESADMVGSAGFEHLPFDGVAPDDAGRVFAQLGSMPEAEARALVGREIFGRLNTSAALPGMMRAVSGWRPDVVISEGGEFSGHLAAEAAGLPQMRVHPGMASTTEFEEAVAPGLADLRSDLGLAPDPIGRALSAPPQVAYFPAAFDLPVPDPRPVLRIRDPRLLGLSSSEKAKLVYVTFGSEAAFLPDFADTVRSAAAGVAAAGMSALVSIGRKTDVEQFADIAGDVRVEQWVDQAEVLRTARAIVCHAGAGTTLAALTAAVPIVAVPLFAEQPLNAARIDAVQAGVVVPPGPDLATRVEAAVRAVTTDVPTGSARLAADIAELPDVTAALRVAEGLVRS